MAPARSEKAKKKALVTFYPDVLDKVEEFRYANRFLNRTAAVNWLLAYALQQKPKREKTTAT